MSIGIILAVVMLFLMSSFYMGRNRAAASADVGRPLHSLPSYYGFYVALWCGIPALLVLGAWMFFDQKIIESLVVSGLPEDVRGMSADKLNLLMNDVRNLARGDIARASTPEPHIRAAVAHYESLQSTSIYASAVLVFAIALIGFLLSYRRIQPALRARNRVEKILTTVLLLSSLIAILTTIGIVLSLLFEAIRFFEKVPLHEFLFGLEWSPQTAIRKDQVGATGAFGMIPVMAGTLLITGIAMIVAVPIGLFSAIYLAEYASRRARAIIKPVMEILAGIPTVVYGFFAALIVAPAIRGFGEGIGLDVASESALAAGMVMGIMIIPFVSSLSDDVINAVPQSLREGSLGMGATPSETIRHVILPAALPGIVGAVLLAVSRAIGETMIVVMAAGLAANLTANPLEAVTTVTVQIVTLLVGDQEFDSAKTLAAFALGLVLFVITLMLNLIALRVVQRYREKYD